MRDNVDSTVVLQSPPIILYQVLDRFFNGSTWLEWDVETLLRQLNQVQDPIAQDKVAAVKSCAFNFNVPCTIGLAFEKTTAAFCNNACVPDSYQPPHMAEVFYAVNQLQQLAGVVQGQPVTFTGEVPGYIAAVAKLRKSYLLPKPLEFAQDMVTFLTGYTPDPGTMALVDNIDALVRANGTEKLQDNSVLDNLRPDNSEQDRSIAALIGYYLFDPTVITD